MAEKLYEYEGTLGRLHHIRDRFKEKWEELKEARKSALNSLKFSEDRKLSVNEDFSHIYRRKTRKELVRVSTAVMGIEFSYAAETAFVSPTLLKIGVAHKHMTLVWALSPLIGFFLTPILGSLSDRCHINLGRRRPFIIMMSIGVLIGLILVPHGEDLGYAMGDKRPHNITYAKQLYAHRTTANDGIDSAKNETIIEFNPEEMHTNYHPWGVFFTILGTVLLDFDADACQSPARAYLLDVTVEEDHARGLSTFTVMAGLGGFFGYALGGINWDATAIGVMLGGHVHAVFSLITVIFIFCVTYTITSFKEMPLYLLEVKGNVDSIPLESQRNYAKGEEDQIDIPAHSYGTLSSTEEQPADSTNSEYETREVPNLKPRDSLIPVHPEASLGTYLRSIVYMPNSLKILCLTNLFCWMAHVCYSLYFTDFVGEAVFGGDPTALEGDIKRDLYEEGVRFGCWGMSMYSLSCACYSMVIEKLIKILGAKKTYVGGLLIYSSGMLLMALTKHKAGVIIFSWTAGVMYSTLFTMPYLLVAHYHSRGTFEVSSSGDPKLGTQVRGLGTDVAVVSSMVFLAQFILSICMGTIVVSSGTTTAVVSVASALAFCGSISATQVLYLDL